ncbi:malate synthase G [Desulfopila aestuarii]|uniref:Malate synthase G n=1 Tax=Desulfopila aestuarii DSM 18488 TaxID=1121416 RepID=A0A1M7XWA0_9BACT|nr:malate synthase G [Desulfopila aestuarii]SHO42886.1 malate synthase [Desulfopila aestuarii DSM 18488]
MQEIENNRIQVGHLAISEPLFTVIEKRIGPFTGVAPTRFWASLETLVREMAPTNQVLLAKRDELQTKIDDYHRQRAGQPHDALAYKTFLEEIGYLLPEGEDFTITTGNVDPEIATIAGPQLVVPVTNARYAVNAVNGRWGSLYDALYGTDVLPVTTGAAPGSGYNPLRGKEVMAYASSFLDRSVPLNNGKHAEVVEYKLTENGGSRQLAAVLASGSVAGLVDGKQFTGYRKTDDHLKAILLKNNGLHLEIQIDRDHPIGKDHPAGVKDLLMESAITTICDCEDSVAVVDGGDKALTYSNWFGLIRGDLTATLHKGGKTITRRLNPDRQYTAPDGAPLTLSGRSLMLIRNVGHLMTTDAVLMDGCEIPEGMLDTMVTAYVALSEQRGEVQYANSRHGSVYIVKPKMHGPEEVAFTCSLFTRTEELLGLPSGTLKIGIMDEERRTSVNLKACIREARDRIIFINTGFLDRTGDEIHTSMEAGPMVKKEAMKNARWIGAYEDRNVDIGLAAGFTGRAQIGKGMWPKPDMMAEMVKAKIGHLRAGANCAWVPSPTAATLHAMHYHEVDVFARQRELSGRATAGLESLLELPLLTEPLTPEEIQRELENNAQSILGYVVRWVEQGIGCSKVPDITDVGLMEDRATLRISSQYLANWMHHGICTKEEVLATFQRMAVVVDRQNENDPAYRPMAESFATSVAFQAACDLVFCGREQPNGYTEPILHARRREAKRLIR